MGEEKLSQRFFLEASDFTEAVKIARSHPGPQYGVSVEGAQLDAAAAADIIK